MSKKRPNPTPRSPKKTFLRWVLNLGLAFTAALITLGLVVFALYLKIQSELPDVETLKDARYQSPMLIYSKEGLLIGQYGQKLRTPLAFSDIPPGLVQAFLAAEDGRFYEHPGVDYQGLLRAVYSLVRTGRKSQGGSTITMQVARNFFLSNEKTYLRKVKEIMLAMKIESEFSKEKILELYLNKIYLGRHAYGVAAAAQVYYDKSIDQLDMAEMAMIAGLPKAPSTFNPIVNPKRAAIRRDYVLDRMHQLGFIDEKAYADAHAAPLTAVRHGRKLDQDLPYVAEIIRSKMYHQFGENAYLNGYRVYTTIDTRLQLLAEEVLRTRMHEFDERHSFRGIDHHIDLDKYPSESDWDQQLESLGKIGLTQPALVVALKGRGVEIYRGDGQYLQLSASDLSWVRRHLAGLKNKGDRNLKVGDVLRLRPVDSGWRVTQIPEVGAALVSLLPQDGAVLAVAGGYDYRYSKFNRAIQAKRQPGSGFKPVVYSAALNEGMTPSTIINDAPFSIGRWTPQNSSRRYYGPTPLRSALMYSRNVVAVKLLQKVGLDKTIKLAKEFGFEASELPRFMPLALGSGSASPLRMAQVFSVFANGGFHVDPYFIERVETSEGRTLYQATPPTGCLECEAFDDPPEGTAQRVLSAKVHYMMNAMLQDVVRGGTGTRALELGRSDVGGKTGTTNDFHDAWFNGYVPAMVTIAWFGYDSYQSLGRKQMGGTLALPMWLDYMKVALRDVPEFTFPAPDGGRKASPPPSPKGEAGEALTGTKKPNPGEGSALNQARDSAPRSESTGESPQGGATPEPGKARSLESLF